MAVFGVACRLLSLLTLAFTQPPTAVENEVVFEVSTPHTTAVDGLLVCLAAPLAALTADTVSIVRVRAGGDQFLEPGSDTTLESFLNTAEGDWGVAALEFGGVADFLGNDEYYADTFEDFRYDNILQGNQALLGATPGERASNCVLITAQWSAATRYEVTLALQNPERPADGAASELDLRVFPLTYEDLDSEHVGLFVRGPKEGVSCPALAGLTTTFGQSPTPADVETVCELPELFSARFLECVTCNCDIGADCNPTTSGCDCPGLQARVGLAACDGAQTIQQIANEQCEFFSEQRGLMMRKLLSDKLVLNTYVDIFLERASVFLDEYAVRRAREVYELEFVRDGRWIESPTRHQGLLPNCFPCTDGKFKNAVNDKQAELEDRRFNSLKALRFIGYLLFDAATVACPDLWDPNARDRSTILDERDLFEIWPPATRTGRS